MVKLAEKVRDILKDTGYNCTLVNARFVKPIDEALLEELAKPISWPLRWRKMCGLAALEIMCWNT